MKRIGVVLLLVVSAVGVGAPAAAGPGDASAGTEVRIGAEGFGSGATGIGDYKNLSSTAVGGVASSSYEYPPPSWSTPGEFWSCPPNTGCAGWDASAHSSVDVAAGELKAFAQTSIFTGGGVDNAGFSNVTGSAYINDTITLSEPATVTLEGTVHVRHGARHSHHGWYGDPRAKLEVDLGFRREGTDEGEWTPWEDLGGYEERFDAQVSTSCPYPATCGGDPMPPVGPTEVTRPFSIDVPLPAGTTDFNARMLADIQIQVWGTRGDEHRNVHGASALIDGANTLQFEIHVPDGVVATSGSGLLPIVGGGVTTPEDTASPTITCDEAPTAWQGANVTLACTATDAGSGLADPADASFTLTTSVADGVETATATTESREVCDVAGNCATAGPIGHVKVDRKAPSLSFQGNAGVYQLGDEVEIRCVAEDGGSGIASNTCEDVVGPASDFSFGEHTVTATVVDAVGNQRTASTSFQVVAGTPRIEDLIRQYVDDPGLEQALLKKLEAAASAPNANARKGKLGAFVNQVRAQSGKALTHAQAQELERLAATY